MLVACTQQCWCGGDRTDYDVHGTTTCTFPCAGNEDEICGGSYAMSVYSNDGTVPDDDTTPAPVTTLDPTSAPVTTLDPTPAPVTVPDGPTPSPITILMQPTPSPITILMEPTPSPIGVDEPAEYLGCFADSKDTRFMTGPNVETVMSAEVCTCREGMRAVDSLSLFFTSVVCFRNLDSRLVVFFLVNGG